MKQEAYWLTFSHRPTSVTHSIVTATLHVRLQHSSTTFKPPEMLGSPHSDLQQNKATGEIFFFLFNPVWTTGPTSDVSILCTLALGIQGGASNPLFHVQLSLQSLWNFVVLHFKERLIQVGKMTSAAAHLQGARQTFLNNQMCKQCIKS